MDSATACGVAGFATPQAAKGEIYAGCGGNARKGITDAVAIVVAEVADDLRICFNVGAARDRRHAANGVVVEVDLPGPGGARVPKQFRQAMIGVNVANVTAEVVAYRSAVAG
jgi:hypothetical protein